MYIMRCWKMVYYTWLRNNFLAKSVADVENWIKGLDFLLLKENSLTYLQNIDVWIHRLFDSVSNSGL